MVYLVRALWSHQDLIMSVGFERLKDVPAGTPFHKITSEHLHSLIGKICRINPVAMCA